MAGFPILSESIKPELASEKLVEILTHGMRIITEVDGISKDRVGAAMYLGDDHVAWVTVDKIPVYRAVILPVTEEREGADYLVVQGHGTWLPSYRQFAVEVEPPGLDFDDAELVDEEPGEFSDKTDPDIDPLAN